MFKSTINEHCYCRYPKDDQLLIFHVLTDLLYIFGSSDLRLGKNLFQKGVWKKRAGCQVDGEIP